MYGSRMDLIVKLVTLPFTDFEFYKKDYFEVLQNKKVSLKANDKDSVTYYKKNELMPKIYEIIHKTQRIHNLDEVDLIAEKFFLSKLTRNHKSDYLNLNEFYIKHLEQLSKNFLTHKNGKICLKYWSTREEFLQPYNGIQKIALWNSLNRIFTTDLIVIMYFLDNGMDDEKYLNAFHSQVMIEDLQLEQILSEGMAETHIHMYAGGDFTISWQELMSLKVFKNNDKDDDLLKHASVLGKNFDIDIYVKVMALTRVIMAKYLYEYKYNSEENFYKYFLCEFLDILDYDIKEEVKSIIDSVINGVNLKSKEINFRTLFDKLKVSLDISEKNDDIDMWGYNLAKRDVIYHFLNIDKNIKTSVENIFLFRALEYIRNNDDCYFSKLFWQYIRIKNEVFQIKIQSNLIKGLTYFQHYYHMSTKYEYNRKLLLGLILHNQLYNGYLKKLELRIVPFSEKSIEKTKKTIAKWFKSFFSVYKEILIHLEEINNIQLVPLVGVVFHFIKEQDETGLEKCWMNFNDRESGELYFRKLQEKYNMQMTAINGLREEIIGLDKYIVGIDAASNENNTEPWVFAPIYEDARDSKTHKPIYESNKKIRNLGFTFHVGEDFRHILTGLRRIHEVIEHFKFHAGDRIGHGIALGIDASTWFKNHRVVTLTRIEYLENLLWVWGIYKEGRYVKEFDMAYIEQEIMEHAEKIFVRMEGITVYNLWSSYREKFKSFSKAFNENINRISEKEIFCPFVDNQHAIMWNAKKLNHAYHCKCYLIKMLEPIQIEVRKEDVKMIEQVQKIVRAKVSKEGIIVETNPTSNTAIGEIENIFEHYISNLNQRGLNSECKSENGLMVTINTDDPSVFNTNLVNEFGYIFYALQEKGYTREDILKWIDKVRLTGLRSSFIETRNVTFEQLREEIDLILENLNQYY